MKKHFTSVIIVLTASLLLVSCKEDKKKNLIRTWKVGDIRISEEVPEEQKVFFDAMLQQMKDYLRVTYKEDGSFTASFMGKNSEGKWELNKDFTELSAIDETQKTMKYKVITLTKDSLIYATAEEGMSPVTFVLLPGDTLETVPAPHTAPIPSGEPSAEK